MTETKALWVPSKKQRENSNLYAFLRWLKENKKQTFDNYESLYQWSVENSSTFWETLWEFFNIPSHSPYSCIQENNMPNTQWFKGCTINYTEKLFEHKKLHTPAIIYKKEHDDSQNISWNSLHNEVIKLQQWMKQIGIQKGDCVAAYLNNSPQATIAFLATVSIGAIWSVCSPEFGSQSVIDRFEQIKPKLFIATNGYQYHGKKIERTNEITTIVKNIPSIQNTLIVQQIETQEKIKLTHKLWNSIETKPKQKLEIEAVDFNHPLWILYSSGTTGKPKAITHSHGGILLEQLKYLHFHANIKAGDRMFWFTTTGWMMWNYLQGGLLLGATIVLYDGSPGFPNINCLWNLIDELAIKHFGISAAFVQQSRKKGIQKKNWKTLESIGSTGSPLLEDDFQWLYNYIKKDLWVASISGGTDICSAFVGGLATKAVYKGEIQCIALGCQLKVYDEKGQSIENKTGEMVIEKPMPSMPIYFWNDPMKERYKQSYFERFHNVWKQGDWIKINDRKSIIIYGRSDASLNRGGIRIGTSEIYRALQNIEEIADSLIVCIDKRDGSQIMPLFVQLQKGCQLDLELENTIRMQIKKYCSPRHLPSLILEIPEVPYTLSGKKMESPIKKILMGMNEADLITTDAMKNPHSIAFFRKLTL